MLTRRDEPFPYEAVRDLLGIVRGLYGAAKVRGAGKGELERIARIGRELSESIDLAVSTKPGSLGHRAAWKRAEDATHAIAEFVDAMTPAEPILQAARGRIVGQRKLRPKPRDER